MKGDFSRIRFDRKRQYTAVLTQQGRVQLDADANEQRAIDEDLRATGLTDIVGRTGAPQHLAGFAISVPSGADTLQIGPGRYYVDGLMCEAAAQLDYRQQPYLIGPQPPIASLLTQLRLRRIAAVHVWLEAWQRLVTPIDDPCIKDVALGEADTTVRVQTVWRVVAEAAGRAQAIGRRTECCEEMRKLALRATAPGEMAAGTSDSSGQGPCLPAPEAAYRGLENQLYRVEVHRGGPRGQATFKWSRENGSVMTRITAVSGAVVTVDSLGPDANLGFAPLQWVEISDDSDEFGPQPNRPGELRQIRSIDPDHLRITLTEPAPAVDVLNGHAKLRRWDQGGDDAANTGVPMASDAWHELENGIRVRFSDTRPFTPGDHWLVPARTATGELDWPPCESDGAEFQPARTVRIHRAPLACIHFDPDRRGLRVDDCRDLFAPLTELRPPVIPPALHVTAISWTNDELLTIDQLAFQGLTVTLDGQAAPPVDAATFIVALEIPTGSSSRGEGIAVVGAASAGGVLRYTAILDGTVTVKGNTLAWASSLGVFSQLYTPLANTLEALANDQVFIRARVTLKGRAIRAAEAQEDTWLDGQCFGLPALRRDGSTPRTDLRLPSGDNARASDFESWFLVTPVQRIETIAVTPARVAFVVVPGTRIIRLVDATGTPSPTAPAVVPTLTLELAFNAVENTTIALAVSGGTPGIVTLPANVTILRGARSPADPVQVQVRNPGPVTQAFTLTATLTLASGHAVHANTTLTVIGTRDPGDVIITSGPVISPFFNDRIIQPGTG